MDDPVAEIALVIETLCTASPAVQRAAIETYFTTTASFTHPFCRTGSFAGSIWLIIMIYRWYKILSPHIDVGVDSIAFDKDKLLLYVSVHQNFKLWMVPFYNAPVKLVTVLQLTTDPIPPEPVDPLEAAAQASLAQQEKGKGREANGKKQTTFAGAGSKSKNKARKENSYDSVSSKEGGDDDEKDKYYIQSQNDLYQTSEFIKFLVPWGIGVLFVVLWQFWATIFCVLGTKVYDIVMWLPHRLSGAHFEAPGNDSREGLGAD